MSKGKKALNEASPSVSIVFATRPGPTRSPPHATAKSSVSSPPIDGLFFSLIRLHVSPVGNACQVPSRLLTHCVSNTLDERSRSFSGTEGFAEAATVFSPVERRFFPDRTPTISMWQSIPPESVYTACAWTASEG